MPALMSHLLLAFRSLRRSPTFSATAIGILALGIGMSVAMFTTFRALLIERLPVADQDRLVVLWAVGPNGVEAGGNKLILEALRREARTVTAAAGVVHWGSAEFPLIDGDRSIVLNQAIVEANFFDVLGARATLGRLFRSGDEAAKREGPEQPIVISYQTWRRQFGGDPEVAGRQLINPYTRSRYTIVGVAPPGLDYPAGVNYWLAVARDMDLNLITVARLRAGATPEAARA
jgi:putative ABC transport system permease protein